MTPEDNPADDISESEYLHGLDEYLAERKLPSAIAEQIATLTRQRDETADLLEKELQRNIELNQRLVKAMRACQMLSAAANAYKIEDARTAAKQVLAEAGAA